MLSSSPSAQASGVVMRGAAAATSADAGHRVESDTMGKVNVPNDVYWGAQTQRSLENFKIGGAAARMPIEIIRGACAGVGALAPAAGSAGGGNCIGSV